MSQLKRGDILVYEPLPEYVEAQELYGAVGVVVDDKEHTDYFYRNTIVVEWLCKISSSGQGQWTVTLDNCRKIGHVKLPPDAV